MQPILAYVTRPEEMLVDESTSATVKRWGDAQLLPFFVLGRAAVFAFERSFLQRKAQLTDPKKIHMVCSRSSAQTMDRLQFTVVSLAGHFARSCWQWSKSCRASGRTRDLDRATQDVVVV